MQEAPDNSASPRPLRVFLCHSSGDKRVVRDLCRRLQADHFDPWLDEERLLPGQDWREEIPKAVHDSHVVIVCLSRASVTKEGYLQKEIKYALDVADEKPEGTIFIIPLKLEECDVPNRLSQWQWANLFEANGYERLMLALKKRDQSIGATVPPDLDAAPRKDVRLRSDKATLSTDEAKVMIATRNFYRADWNEGGMGIAHQYESQILQGALVVLDHATGLMWQKGGSGEPVGLQGAGDYVRALNTRKFGGFDDWRLPTLEEAMSLMTTPEGGRPREAMYGEETRQGVYHIDRVFEKGAAYFIWTADLQSPGRAWVVYFWDGICHPESLDFNASVRAVRSLRKPTE